MAGAVGRAKDWRGSVRFIVAGMVRSGEFRCAKARLGAAGEVRRVTVCSGRLWIGAAGKLR